MSVIDLTAILSNLAQSLLSVERLVKGLGFMVGIWLVIIGLFKLTKIDKHSHEGYSVPLACIGGGMVLLYLPESVITLSNGVFGGSNILSYANTSVFSVYDSMGVLLKTAGLIWFVRGTVLLVHAADPGRQKGLKGLLFVVSGVLSMNFSYTISAINSIFVYFENMTGKVF